MNAKHNFKSTYTLARSNKRNQIWTGEFFKFNGVGNVYITTCGGVVVTSDNILETAHPGFRAAMIGGGFSPGYRKFNLDRSRKLGRVPLP